MILIRLSWTIVKNGLPCFYAVYNRSIIWRKNYSMIPSKNANEIWIQTLKHFNESLIWSDGFAGKVALLEMILISTIMALRKLFGSLWDLQFSHMRSQWSSWKLAWKEKLSQLLLSSIYEASGLIFSRKKIFACEANEGENDQHMNKKKTT